MGNIKYLVLIVLSTGGPEALSTVIPNLKYNPNISIVIVQHMPIGFTEHLANRLNSISEFRVKETVHDEKIQGGTVYIAKAGLNLLVNNDLTFKTNKQKISSYHIPSGDVLFNSVAENLENNIELIAIVLTGMGRDGLEGIKKLKESRKKDVVVISQKTESCFISSMPKAIEANSLNDFSMDLNEIKDYINSLK